LSPAKSIDGTASTNTTEVETLAIQQQQQAVNKDSTQEEKVTTL
jgi:hypothetical protein